MSHRDHGDGGPLHVALLGLGTVGRAVAQRLIDDRWREHVARHGAVPPTLAAVGVPEPDRPRGISLPPSVRRTDDLDALVADPSIDVVVELMGGVARPAALVERALSAGKPVVTANKALVARLGPGLEAVARRAGVALRFEAAVAGGVPVLTPLVRDLAASRVTVVRGIVNGTTNYILTAMSRDGRPYEAALDDARAAGYAEAEATADVEGADAVDKLAILARLAFGAWPAVERIRREAPATVGDARPGITPIRPIEMRLAAELGLALKLIAEARTTDAGIAAGVLPTAVPTGSPLGATDGVTNLVEVIADLVGVVSFRGPGAGGDATSSAVLADLLALGRGEGSTWDPRPEPSAPLRVVDPLGGRRCWFLVATDSVGESVAERLTDITSRGSGGGIVTDPMILEELRSRLGDRGVHATLYPVLVAE